MDPTQIQFPISWTMGINEEQDDDGSSCPFMQPHIGMMSDSYGFKPNSRWIKERYSYQNDRRRALWLIDFTLEDHCALSDKWVREVAEGKPQDSLPDSVYGRGFWVSSSNKESKVSISQEEIHVFQQGIVAVSSSQKDGKDPDSHQGVHTLDARRKTAQKHLQELETSQKEATKAES